MNVDDMNMSDRGLAVVCGALIGILAAVPAGLIAVGLFGKDSNLPQAFGGIVWLACMVIAARKVRLLP